MMKMRMTRVLNIAVLSTLVATSAAIYAQDEKPQEPKPPKQEESRPEPKQEEMKAPKQQDQMKPAQQGDMKPEKQQEEAKPRQQEEAKPSKDEQKAQKEQQKQQEKQTKEQMKQDKNHQQPAAAQGNETHAGGSNRTSATAIPSWCSALLWLRDSRALFMAGIRSFSSMPGREIGLTPTIATSTTSTASISCSMCGIRESGSRCL
jgi:outer membrane biosynthesis protein TonB